MALKAYQLQGDRRCTACGVYCAERRAVMDIGLYRPPEEWSAEEIAQHLAMLPIEERLAVEDDEVSYEALVELRARRMELDSLRVRYAELQAAMTRIVMAASAYEGRIA
jgi:hypothetical protein